MSIHVKMIRNNSSTTMNHYLDVGTDYKQGTCR